MQLAYNTILHKIFLTINNNNNNKNRMLSITKFKVKEIDKNGTMKNLSRTVQFIRSIL